MILVLFFLGIIAIVLIIVEILILSDVKVKITNDKIEALLYVLGKIPIIKIRLDENKIKEKIKKYNEKENLKIDKTAFKIPQILYPRIEKLDLKLKFGTTNAVYTSFAVTSISIVISVLLPYLVEKKNINNIRYEIVPLYNRQKQYKLKHKLYNLYKNGTYYKYNIYRFEKKES